MAKLRGEILCELNQPECIETLEFHNKLADGLFKARVKWEAKFEKLGRRPTHREEEEYDLWEYMTEEHERDKFYFPEHYK